MGIFLILAFRKRQWRREELERREKLNAAETLAWQLWMNWPDDCKWN